MSDKIGPVSYKLSDEDPFLGREIHEQRQFSEHTMEVIDSEVSALLHEAEQRADDLLIEYRDQLESLTQRLVEAEELSECQIADVIGPSVHPAPQSDEEDTNQQVSSNARPSEDLDLDSNTNGTDEQPAPIDAPQDSELESDDVAADY